MDPWTALRRMMACLHHSIWASLDNGKTVHWQTCMQA